MEWWNWATIGLSTLGVILGIRSERWRFSERNREARRAFDVALLKINPVIKKGLALPIESPFDLANLDHNALSKHLSELNIHTDEAANSVIESMPHLFDSIDKITSSISIILESLEAGRNALKLFEAIKAFENLFSGLQSLVLLEEYKRIKCEPRSSFNLHGNPNYLKFQERHYSFMRQRIHLEPLPPPPPRLPRDGKY